MLNTLKKHPEVKPEHSSWRSKLFEIIFEADTPAGKNFDILLIICILMSVLVVMLDSVQGIQDQYGFYLEGTEWFFTVLFTMEYILRIICVNHPTRYAFSFFGVVDLMAIVPTYLRVILPGGQFLLVIRLLRVLRIFRILKLAHHLSAANILIEALKASTRKIFVFLYTVLTLVVILGSLMYLVEGKENGFTSIPRSIYWAIATLSTVGFGDIYPQTPQGQTLASFIMLLGYGLIAVPTGIVTVEMARTSLLNVSSQVCPHCCTEGHEREAVYCKKCGGKL